MLLYVHYDVKLKVFDFNECQQASVTVDKVPPGFLGVIYAHHGIEFIKLRLCPDAPNVLLDEVGRRFGSAE